MYMQDSLIGLCSNRLNSDQHLIITFTWSELQEAVDFLQRHGPALISTYFRNRAVSPHRPGWRWKKSETGGAKRSFVPRMIEWFVSKQLALEIWWITLVELALWLRGKVSRQSGSWLDEQIAFFKVFVMSEITPECYSISLQRRDNPLADWNCGKHVGNAALFSVMWLVVIISHLQTRARRRVYLRIVLKQLLHFCKPERSLFCGCCQTLSANS